MPSKGEISAKFGVYKTLCCDFEIVIGQGVKFPDCPRHPNVATIWTPLESSGESSGPAKPNEPDA